MGEANDQRTGVLAVRVEHGSSFLGAGVPIEVRDARQRVVGTGAGSWRQVLPAGLYSVESVSAEGRRLHEVVQVGPGETSEVVLGGSVDQPGGTTPPGLRPPSLARPAAHGVRLLGWELCTVLPDAEGQPDAGGWLFLPVPEPPRPPTARFGVGDQEWLLSLPLNPTTADPALSACRVQAVAAGPRTRLELTFAPGRRVTSFVDGLRRSRSFAKAGPLIAEATDLLLGKYADPAGATLGGLTLQRLGALSPLRGWAENLARGFGWIPDAGVLLAVVLLEDGVERGRGLDLLLAAARQRPMFTDGLSLALDLLRRWPGGPDDRPGERRDALEYLADLSAWADWDCVNLTTVTPR